MLALNKISMPLPARLLLKVRKILPQIFIFLCEGNELRALKIFSKNLLFSKIFAGYLSNFLVSPSLNNFGATYTYLSPLHAAL